MLLNHGVNYSVFWTILDVDSARSSDDPQNKTGCYLDNLTLRRCYSTKKLIGQWLCWHLVGFPPSRGEFNTLANYVLHCDSSNISANYDGSKFFFNIVRVTYNTSRECFFLFKLKTTLLNFRDGCSVKLMTCWFSRGGSLSLIGKNSPKRISSYVYFYICHERKFNILF